MEKKTVLIIEIELEFGDDTLTSQDVNDYYAFDMYSAYGTISNTWKCTEVKQVIEN